MIINLAVPGGLITICVLLFLYYKQEKNGSIEPMLLTIYGIFNLFSGFVYLHECLNANTCPMVWKIFESSFIKTGTCLGTGLTMLAETGSILYVPELQGKLSEYGYNEGFGDPYMSEPHAEPTFGSLPRSDRSGTAQISDPYNEAFAQEQTS